MESLLKRIERNRKEHDRLIALVLCLSLIVSMGTFAVFHKKAVAKTYIRQVLDCPLAAEGAGLVVHTHNDDCYDENHNLVCTLPELEAHTHSDACYTEVPVQVCGLAESVGHIHGSDCRTLMLTCEEEEREATFDEEGNMADPGHIHTPDCYSEVLSCGMEEGDGAHTHTDACYETEYVLACDKPEIRLHVHTDDCYQKNEDGSIYVDEDGFSRLICGLPEIIQHAHGPECFKIYELDDGEPEEADEIVAADEIAAEPAEDTETAESIDEEKTDAEESGDKENTELTETQETKESTDAEDIPVPAVSMPAQSWERTAGGIKVSVEAPEGAFPENTRIAVTPVNGSSLMDTVSDAVNGEVLEVQAVDITFFDADGHEIEPAIPIRVVMTPAATEHAEEKTNVVHVDIAQQTAELIEQAEGTEADNTEVVFDAEAFTIYAIVYTVHFEYEVDGQVYTSTVPGAQDKLLSELIRELNVVNEEQLPEFMTKIREVSFSDPDVLKITETEGDWIIRPLKDSDQEESLTIVMQDGAAFRITVEAEGITEVTTEDETAVISTVGDLYLPEEASATAELLNEEQSENAIAAVQSTEENTAGESNAQTAYQVFDIGLENVDAESYADGFEVTLTLPETVMGRDFRIFHVHDDQVEELELNTVGEAVTDETDLVSSVRFVTPSFSEFVLSYTMDFHYEINGKVYEFSIPGGGFVSLEHLVEALGIHAGDATGANNATDEEFVGENAGNNTGTAEELEVATESEAAYEQAIRLNSIPVSEATRVFVANIATVEFSSPELVWTGKVDEAATVGGLKEANELEVEYSAELTEDQIAEINAQTVEAGDWALVSVRPFLSKETLTITMKNGDQFVVTVTVAQIFTHVITTDGKDFLITVTYGPEAGIPDGAELTARELLPGTEEYETHYAQMLEAVAGEASEAEPDDEMNAAFAEVGLEVVDPQSTVDVTFARFFDISIWKDDVKIEPLAPVQVEIQYVDPVSADSNAEAEVIHFADEGIELINPETDLSESSEEGISSFTFRQSSFSISATLLKYTTGIPNGNYVIIKGSKVNGIDHYYALKADGSTVEVTKNGDTFTNTSNNADDAFWTFTSADNGQYYIQNRSNGGYHLVLYNNIVGNWNQKINVEVPDGRKTVYLKNPNNTPLRFNGNSHTFVLGAQNANAEQFYLARMTSEVPQGQGYNLTPAGETDLGDLNAWKNKVENSNIIVDKTASVVDYDNRIYQIDLKALSDITIIANKVDLELIVDTSRSMYFPANLSPMSGYYFTSIMGNDSHSLEKQLSWLNNNQIYYFIGDGEKATVYALYYAASGTNLNDHTGDQCWKFVDASYMNPPDANAMNQSDRLNRLVGKRIDDLAYSICNQNRDGGGCRLYTATSSITRLAYLKEAVRIASEIVYAVDKDNRIGLVTFNSKATNQGFFEYSNRNSLYSKINNISLAGGTRQDLGLETGKNLLDSNGRADAQKIAILITDGAPNMQDDNKQQIPSETAWTMIGEKASALKGTNSSFAKLYTLGLSLDMVGGNNQSHLDGLASEEDGVTRHFNASNGPDIVRAVKDLIDTLMYDVTLEAEVTDVLDPAFYPVDQNGNPIAAGDYTDDNGKRYNWSKVTVDGAECWKITYYDQEVGRGEKNTDNTIKTPGWQKSFYVKAKEDFLGGNEIQTNRYKSSNNRVKPTKYVYTERGTNSVKKIDPPSNAPWGKFVNTPTVNVDELHLTEHSTEWTVYLGTEVKPEDQVRALWNEIKVKQVVKTDGTANNGTIITGGDKKWYAKTDTEDTAAPDEGYSSLPISRYFTDTDFNTLLDQLKTQDSAEKTINYTAYGHKPGTITVKLEKEIIDGARDANGKAPGQHIADKEGTPAERYTITVTYTPNKTDTSCNVGHVTTGTDADEVKSTNKHIINVFQKGIKITKVDKTNTGLTLPGAVFELFRVDAAGSADVSAYTLPSGNYTKVGGDLTADANGIITINPVIPDVDSNVSGKTLYLPNISVGATENTHDTVFYLMEKTPPTKDGVTYARMPGAIKFTMTLSEDKGTDNTATLYDWTQTATISAEEYENGSTVYLGEDAANTTTGTNSDLYAYILKNERPTDITLIKVDKVTSNSIGGAKFKLLRGSENVDLTKLTITAIEDGAVITPEDFDFNRTTIKVITVPEGGAKIAGLTDGTYTLQEVAAPAGYLITDTGKTFKTENGAIKDADDSLHQNEATDIAFKVENTPGQPLPNTGGIGTELFTIIGGVLSATAGAILTIRRKKQYT